MKTQIYQSLKSLVTLCLVFAAFGSELAPRVQSGQVVCNLNKIATFPNYCLFVGRRCIDGHSFQVQADCSTEQNQPCGSQTGCVPGPNFRPARRPSKRPAEQKQEKSNKSQHNSTSPPKLKKKLQSNYRPVIVPGVEYFYEDETIVRFESKAADGSDTTIFAKVCLLRYRFSKAEKFQRCAFGFEIDDPGPSIPAVAVSSDDIAVSSQSNTFVSLTIDKVDYHTNLTSDYISPIDDVLLSANYRVGK